MQQNCNSDKYPVREKREKVVRMNERKKTIRKTSCVSSWLIGAERNPCPSMYNQLKYKDMKEIIIKKISENRNVSLAEAERNFNTYCEDFASDIFYHEYNGILVYGIGLTIDEAEYIHNYLKSA